MKKRYDIIFITLVYRNYNDLYDFCNSLKNKVKASFKVIVIDAFYDNETSNKIKSVALNLNCCYIQTENLGYGYGNNKGIDYAIKKFDFSYICISNPDVILRKNIYVDQFKKETCIAPRIINSKGGDQNPYWAYENLLSEKLFYLGYTRNLKILIYLGIIINKILKLAFNFNCLFLSKNYIYACHGSFFFLSKQFISENAKIFNENIFLFYEEACLAVRLKRSNIKILYNTDLEVYHKEDGSMKISGIKEYPYLKESYVIYYEEFRL